MANRSLRALGVFQAAMSNDPDKANRTGADNVVQHKNQNFKTAAQRLHSDNALKSLGLGAASEAAERRKIKREL